MFCKVYSAELWLLINLVRKRDNVFLVESVLDLTLLSLGPDSPTPHWGLCDAGAGPSSSPDNRRHCILDGRRRRKRRARLLPVTVCLTQQCFGSFTLVSAGGSTVICFSHRPTPKSQCSLSCLFSVFGVGGVSYIHVLTLCSSVFPFCLFILLTTLV